MLRITILLVATIALLGIVLWRTVDKPANRTHSTTHVQHWTDGTHPLVDARRNELFGGTIDGAWVEAEKMEKRVDGHEQYQLYTATRRLGLTGGSEGYYSEDPEGESEEPFGAACIDITVPESIEKDKTITEDDALIAVSGQWNALPRIPVVEDTTQEKHRKIVRDILTAHGLPKATVNITKIFIVDLEGDGTMEEIIAASVPRNDFPYPPDQVQRNDYSLVILRKTINGEMVTIPVAENYFTRSYKEWLASLPPDGVTVPADDRDRTSQQDQLADPTPNEYTLEAVLDVNGDGVMEIITGWHYYEGIGKTVHQIKNNKAESVLTSGWGV